MPRQPMVEVFGFPVDNMSPRAEHYRQNRLCPFNNRVPNCTKDKAENPLGVCSVFQGDQVAVTCPVRFRQDWSIATDAANFFFPAGTAWTSMTEVRLDDKHGRSAGNIDVVLVAYDAEGQVIDFGAVEVQAVYISGNVRRPFEHYMQDPRHRLDMDWSSQPHYPRPDYLSSSRKRLAPQLLYKGGILSTWEKKMAVVLDHGFYRSLPQMETADPRDADLVWLVYDLFYEREQNIYIQKLHDSVYTQFQAALETITIPETGSVDDFIRVLQARLDARQLNAPDAPILADRGSVDPDNV